MKFKTGKSTLFWWDHIRSYLNYLEIFTCKRISQSSFTGQMLSFLTEYCVGTTTNLIWFGSCRKFPPNFDISRHFWWGISRQNLTFPVIFVAYFHAHYPPTIFHWAFATISDICWCCWCSCCCCCGSYWFCISAYSVFSCSTVTVSDPETIHNKVFIGSVVGITRPFMPYKTYNNNALFYIFFCITVTRFTLPNLTIWPLIWLKKNTFSGVTNDGQLIKKFNLGNRIGIFILLCTLLGLRHSRLVEVGVDDAVLVLSLRPVRLLVPLVRLKKTNLYILTRQKTK